MEIEYRLLTVDDHEKICEMFDGNNPPKNILHSLFRIKDEDSKKRSQKRALNKLKYGMSCGAFVGEKLIGISLNSTYEVFPTHLEVSKEKMNLGRFIKMFESRKQLPFNQEKSLFLGMGSVLQEYCKQGIYTKLISLSLKHAKEMGFAFVTATSTSAYAHKTFDKLQFKISDEILYSEFYDPVLKEFPFKHHQGPHTSVRIYYKQL